MNFFQKIVLDKEKHVGNRIFMKLFIVMNDIN